jgi:phage tail-like protein
VDSVGGPVAGLALDAACRIYRSLPEEGSVVRTAPWRSPDENGGGWPDRVETVPLFAEPAAATVGGFRPAGGDYGPLLDPRDVAVDEAQRLFVAEAGAARILVHDLRERRLVRSLPLGSARPLALAPRSGRVLVATSDPGALVEVTAREVKRTLPFEAGGRRGPVPEAPTRLAVGPGGRLVLLDRGGGDDARVLLLGEHRDARRTPGTLRTEAVVEIAGASDVAFDGRGRLVVSRRPGQDFLRFAFDGGSPVAERPLRARGYDGRGIVRVPDGRILFWTAGGPAHGVEARLRFERRGRVTGFRLDSGAYGTRWGRLYVEACLPDGCGLRVATAATDDEGEGPRIPRIPPAGPTAPPELPGESPPMPPVGLLPTEPGSLAPLHPRRGGSEVPWAPREPDDPFRVLEAPATDRPGRYLWVALELTGNTRRTPLVRALRVHHPDHDLLRRLPRAFSRDRDAAAFLRRYLSMADGVLDELDGAAARREVLLDPRGAPGEALPWLASFLGLVLDERWPEGVRRQAIDEAPWLFRRRGTVPGLRRFVEIYTGGPVMVVEHFRLRSLGGELVGSDSPAFSRSVLGAGLRVGGAVGSEDPRPLEGDAEDAFRTHAHRFTVLVGRDLDDEGRRVVERIIEVHRPAHTAWELCTAAEGMRVGRGLHVGLSSVVGPTGGFGEVRLGASIVGGSDVLGRPGAGTGVGTARLGTDSEVG